MIWNRAVLLLRAYPWIRAVEWETEYQSGAGVCPSCTGCAEAGGHREGSECELEALIREIQELPELLPLLLQQARTDHRTIQGHVFDAASKEDPARVERLQPRYQKAKERVEFLEDQLVDTWPVPDHKRADLMERIYPWLLRASTLETAEKIRPLLEAWDAMTKPEENSP